MRQTPPHLARLARYGWVTTSNGAGAHRRFNPLTGGWVLVSAGRSARPWQGDVEAPAAAPPSHDAECYLCPRNERANGDVNPSYASTFVFENDFAALRSDSEFVGVEDRLLRAEPATGTCRVLCFTPRHDLTVPQLDTAERLAIVDQWVTQTDELGEQHRWVQVFENRGAAMGASSPHPHGQIWAGDALPVEAEQEHRAQRAYLEGHGRPLLLDYLEQELEAGERVVAATEEWVVLVPYWATWPFETLLLPRRATARMTDLDAAQRSGLADAFGELVGRYDALFDRPLPYSMGWHGAPGGRDAGGGEHWQLHAHFYPPLLPSGLRKFMVGYELLAEPQRDLTAEESAAILRGVWGEDDR